MFLYIKSEYINYKVEFNRKVTIIQGDSGTGKSLMIDTIIKLRDTRLVSIFTDNKLEVITYRDYKDWDKEVETGNNKLFLIDEDYKKLTTKEFADMVHKSQNYFIIMCREPLKCLNYSYKEIYTLRKSGKYVESRRKYNDQLFNELNRNCEIILVEDSNAGYDFYKFHLDSVVESIQGKSKILSEFREIKSRGYKNIGLILDGAALGNEMDDILNAKTIAGDVCIQSFTPECLEEFIVNSGVLKFKTEGLKELHERQNMYGSYEIMYYEYLKEITRNTPAQYNKNAINTCYIEDCCHKKCPKCIFYKDKKKRDVVQSIIYNGCRKGNRDDKLLF